MKILAVSKEGKVERYIKDPEFYKEFELVYASVTATDEEILEKGGDADIIIADAISRISANVIKSMPKLKMIHSEGVAYNGIDVAAAKAKGVYVCNCKAMNATAVAEQAVLLMLGLLRGVVSGDKAVREGRQMDVKMSYMQHGNLKEIADCKIGFIGFGDIAMATAKLVKAMGAEICYYKRSRLSAELEAEYGAEYATLDELLKESDIVSMHIPVTESTMHMADAEFFNKMKEGAYFVNTSRGELVVAADLLDALRSGKLAGAGLDTIEGEPVTLDNEMLTAEEEVAEKILYSPHIGGITASSFRRGYAMIYEDIMKLKAGEAPGHLV